MFNKKQKKSISTENKNEIKEKLNDLQYYVTQEKGTEPAYNNEYWNEKREGVYFDIVDGTPLFLSTDKFDSGTGWPSFTKPIEKGVIEEQKDFSHGMIRTEVKSNSGSHLGHLFKNDFTSPNGKRYCMNSASLNFIPREKLKNAGHSELEKHFRNKKGE